MWKYFEDGSIREPEDFPIVLNVFNSLDKFDVLGLASYNCIDETLGSSVWYLNANLNLPRYHEILSCLPHQQTFDYILNYKNENVKQMSIRHLVELKHCIEKFNVNQIYLAGAAWEMCLKDREVGYENIIKYFPKIELFVDNNLVATCEGTFPDISSDQNWERIEKSLYRYKKNNKIM